MPTGFIDDDYTLPFYIKPLPDAYPAIRGTRRPLIQTEASAHNVATEKCSETEHTAAVAKVLAAHIKSWSVKDSKGESVVPTVANMLKLDHVLFRRLATLVWGDVRTDLDPNWSDDEKKQFADPTDLEREAADEKN